MRRPIALAMALAVAAVAPSAFAEDLQFSDPSGDDFGPGSYTYPTDAVYVKGSFDLKKLEIRDKGDNVEIRATMRARIEDPWDSKSWPEPGNGFSVQMLQVYLDTTPDAGHTDTLPGINAQFAKADAWDKVVIISPQPKSRVRQELKLKGGALKGDSVVPKKTYARGNELIAVVAKKDLGGEPTKAWGVQVVVQSNEGYPDKDEILSRKVNEYNGQHRFGGGNDYNCDPHVMDILVAPAKGGGDEKDGQKKALAYKCGDEGKRVQVATLPMVRMQ